MDWNSVSSAVDCVLFLLTFQQGTVIKIMLKPSNHDCVWAILLKLPHCTCVHPFFLLIQSQDEEQSTISVPVFHWIAVHNLTSLDHCRNSKQGHTLIADELGQSSKSQSTQ